MPALLVLAFIVVPILEVFVIVEVAGGLGWPLTLVLLLAVAVGGSWLVRREGRNAWQNFRTALAQGRVPAREVVDGALVLVGGTMLLLPGFLTDVVGVLLVLPPSRAVFNRLVRSRTRLFVLTGAGAAARRTSRAPRPQPAPDVVDVEVVDVRRNNGDRREQPRS